MMIGAEKLKKAMASISIQREQDFQIVLIENTTLTFVGGSRHDYLNVSCAIFFTYLKHLNFKNELAFPSILNQ